MCDPGGRAAAQWLVLAVIAAVSVPLVVFYFEDRHRLPYLPMVHILGAGVIANCITVYGARRQQAGPQTRALDNLSRTSE